MIFDIFYIRISALFFSKDFAISYHSLGFDTLMFLMCQFVKIKKNVLMCFFSPNLKKISFTVRINHTIYIYALFSFYAISVNEAGVRVATDTAIQYIPQPSLLYSVGFIYHVIYL